uniref:BPTI/Kunitz inhibitor domain-containing protein n=1 Tax=Amblyomma maculatum TaxID=34609 RepID=G3MSH0_AMBMU
MLYSFTAQVFLPMVLALFAGMILEGGGSVVMAKHLEHVSARDSSEKTCRQMNPKQPICQGKSVPYDIFRYGFDPSTSRCFEYMAASCTTEDANEFTSYTDCLKTCYKDSICLKYYASHENHLQVGYYFDTNSDQCENQTRNALNNQGKTVNLFSTLKECNWLCAPTYYGQ